jgi:LysM repeat protein
VYLVASFREKEDVVNRSFISRHWILSLAILVMFSLVACERPLQEDIEQVPSADAPALLIPDVQLDGIYSEPRPPLINKLTIPNGYPEPDKEPGLTSGVPAEGITVVPDPVNLVFHEVQSGDILVNIARQYDVTVEEIVAANNLPSADVLEIGQRLIIPAEGFVASEAPAVVPAAAPAEEPSIIIESADQIHTVQSGDNLYRIALLYGCGFSELATYNNLTNPDSLEVGQEILIPACE